MSREDLDVVRALLDGWLSGDPATIDMVSEDVVYVASSSMPGGDIYHGREGVLRWFVNWRREWGDYELEVVRIEDLGDRVLTIERNRATGKRSGAVVDMETGSLWTVREGKVVRWEGFASAAEALHAAGVEA
jgi:ketosteroid isomerase-like protein